jgi:hypothetical protein
VDVVVDVVDVVELPLEPPPPPHAASSAAVMLTDNNRDALGTMIDVSSS